MSASGLLQPSTKVLYSGTISATGATPAFSLGISEGYYAELVVTTATGTIDAVLQHSTDNGITYRSLPLKFAQLAAAGSTGLVFKAKIGLSDAAFPATPALTGAAVATNTPFNVKNVRLFVTLGTPGANVLSLIVTTTPNGQLVQ